MIRLLTPVVALGLFCVIASYSYGRFEPHHRQDAPQHADSGTSFRTPPDCGLDWLCLKSWAEGKSAPKGTDTDGMARLVQRSLADAKRHRVLAGNDDQAALRVLWGDEQ